MSRIFEDWDSSLQQHAQWVNKAYPSCELSDDYIEGLVDEASYGFSFAIRIVQTLVVLAVFGWLGESIGSQFGSQYSGTIGLVLASFGLLLAYFLWSKSSPIHKYLIRRSIRSRLRDLQPD